MKTLLVDELSLEGNFPTRLRGVSLFLPALSVRTMGGREGRGEDEVRGGQSPPTASRLITVVERESMAKRSVFRRVCHGCDKQCEWESMVNIELSSPDFEATLLMGTYCRRCAEEVAIFLQGTYEQPTIFYKSI